MTLNVLIQNFKQRHKRKSRMKKKLPKDLMELMTWIWSKAQALNPLRHAHRSSKLSSPLKTLVNVRDFLTRPILYLIMATSWTEKRYSRSVYVIVYWSKVLSNSSGSLTSMNFSNLTGKETYNINTRKKGKFSHSNFQVFKAFLNSNRWIRQTETIQI